MISEPKFSKSGPSVQRSAGQEVVHDSSFTHASDFAVGTCAGDHRTQVPHAISVFVFKTHKGPCNNLGTFEES